MFKELKKWNAERKIRDERDAFIRDHNIDKAPMTDEEERAWETFLEKNNFEQVLGRMNFNIGNAVDEYLRKYPDWTVGEICRLVFNRYPNEVKAGIGDTLPNGIHRTIWTAAENVLVAELVTRKKINLVLSSL